MSGFWGRCGMGMCGSFLPSLGVGVGLSWAAAPSSSLGRVWIWSFLSRAYYTDDDSRCSVTESLYPEVSARFSTYHESIRTETGSPACVPTSRLMERWLTGDGVMIWIMEMMGCFVSRYYGSPSPLLLIHTHLFSPYTLTSYHHI